MQLTTTCTLPPTHPSWCALAAQEPSKKLQLSSADFVPAYWATEQHHMRRPPSLLLMQLWSVTGSVKGTKPASWGCGLCSWRHIRQKILSVRFCWLVWWSFALICEALGVGSSPVNHFKPGETQDAGRFSTAPRSQSLSQVQKIIAVLLTEMPCSARDFRNSSQVSAACLGSFTGWLRLHGDFLSWIYML